MVIKGWEWAGRAEAERTQGGDATVNPPKSISKKGRGIICCRQGRRPFLVELKWVWMGAHVHTCAIDQSQFRKGEFRSSIVATAACLHARFPFPFPFPFPAAHTPHMTHIPTFGRRDRCLPLPSEPLDQARGSLFLVLLLSTMPAPALPEPMFRCLRGDGD